MTDSLRLLLFTEGALYGLIICATVGMIWLATDISRIDSEG